MALPTISTLWFHPPRGRPRLVQATLPTAGNASSAPAAAAVPGQGYRVRHLIAPPSLVQLADAGAAFGLSRYGHLRVWMAGALYAAEQQADCDERPTRALTAQEVEYLGCYLICTGHLWNDAHTWAAQAGCDP